MSFFNHISKGRNRLPSIAYLIIWSLVDYFRKITKYRKKGDRLIMSKPYYDWGGAGEITTIGKPFYHKDKLVGVVSLDYALKGIGNTPRDNSIFFNDGFKSYLVIIEYDEKFKDDENLDLKDGFIIAHPLKRTPRNDTLDGSTKTQPGFQFYNNDHSIAFSSLPVGVDNIPMVILT